MHGSLVQFEVANFPFKSLLWIERTFEESESALCVHTKVKAAIVD